MAVRTVIVAASVAASLAVGAPAIAAPRPKPQRFTAQGLVVASTPTTLRVITRTFKVGKSSMPANTVVTVRRPASGSRSMVGYAVTLSGNATRSGRTLKLAASSVQAAPRPAEVFLGEVAAVNGTLLRVAASSAAGGDDFGDENNLLAVDTSAATGTVDGAAGTPSAGDFVIVLGERSGNTVVAATVDAYTTAPDAEAGEITAISGTTVTLGSHWSDSGDDNNAGAHSSISVRHGGDSNGDDGRATGGGSGASGSGASGSNGGDNSGDDNSGDSNNGDDNNGDGTTTTSTIDLADIPIVLNGTSTVDVTRLATGDKLITLGTTATDGTFTPQIAFAFDRHNDHPADRHHNGDD